MLLVLGREVPLADRVRGVPVGREHGRQECARPRDPGVVTGEARWRGRRPVPCRTRDGCDRSAGTPESGSTARSCGSWRSAGRWPPAGRSSASRCRSRSSRAARTRRRRARRARRSARRSRSRFLGPVRLRLPVVAPDPALELARFHQGASPVHGRRAFQSPTAAAARGARERLCDRTADHARHELVAVDVTARHRHLHHPRLLRIGADRGEVEVAESVADERRAVHARPLQSMRVTADDDVRAGVGRAGRQESAARRSDRCCARYPSAGRRRRCPRSLGPAAPQRPARATSLRRCEPGMTRPGCPRRDELVVDHLCGRDDRDALALRPSS